METFFSFAFGRFENHQEFIQLIESVSVESEIKTLQLLISQTSGLEPANFDNLALALSTMKLSNPEFVLKTVDLVMCEAISDLKVKHHFLMSICSFLFRDLILLTSKKS